MAIDEMGIGARGFVRMALAVIVAGTLAAGCGGDGREADDGEPRTRANAMATALPVPEGARGGAVTGMPDRPGPGAIGLPDPAADALPDAQTGFDPDGDVAAAADGGDALLDHPAMRHPDADQPPEVPVPGSDEPDPQEAVSVVLAYHAALNDRSFGRAYRLWSGGGAATGQSLQQFADGFAETDARTLEILAPGRIDATAGSRYIEVPVAIEETRRDGSVRRYVGAYTLRRAAAQRGAQRGWQIASADLREVQL